MTDPFNLSTAFPERRPAATDRPAAPPSGRRSAERAPLTASRLRRTILRPGETAMRRCLCCEVMFASAHAGNRICPACHGSDEFQAAPMLEPYSIRAERRR